MEHLRNVVCALLLTTVLAFSAIAGEIQNPGDEPPPPPTSTESSTAGEIQNPGLTATVLELVASVLAMF
jgi:hypothetical protein